MHGVDYAGRYRTALDHERVGGDFYDVHPGPDDSAETFVALGDVAGKGLDAAVLTGKIRNTLHALLPLASDHLRVLRMLNDALLTSHHARFATLVLASVRRLDDGAVRLRLTGAGHLPPLVVRADGRVEEVPTQGTLVGALPEVTARTVETVLARGTPACCTPTASPRPAAARSATNCSARSGCGRPWRVRRHARRGAGGARTDAGRAVAGAGEPSRRHGRPGHHRPRGGNPAGGRAPAGDHRRARRTA